jgi:hypothetical protein
VSSRREGITRRRFLLDSVLLAAGVAEAERIDVLGRVGWVRRLFPGWRREPWVRFGGFAPLSYIGRHPHPNAFIGGVTLLAVEKWDGNGYPVQVAHPSYPRRESRYYDHDLAEFSREVPDRFWHEESNRDSYPNVHTYVRMQRYGETRDQAIRHLNFVSSARDL